MSAALAWFAARTSGAPERLSARAAGYLTAAEAEAGGLAAQLALAGQRALDASIAAGDDRAAAIDLLAADALITLALLRLAEERPEQLQSEAQALRTLSLVGQ